jgi:benzoylformate decarboxylase
VQIARRDHCRRARDAYRAAQDVALREGARLAETTPIRVPALLHALASLLGDRARVVADAVTGSAGALTYLLPCAARGFHTTASGSLGWGMGAALGIKLAAPEDDLVAVVGDGVFQFGLQALWTAVHDATQVTWVVINNQSYAAVKSALQRYGGAAAARGEYPASAIPGPDIAAIARGFGAFGQRIERLTDLAPAFQAAHDHNGPAVIEVLTDPDDVGPRPT